LAQVWAQRLLCSATQPPFDRQKRCDHGQERHSKVCSKGRKRCHRIQASAAPVALAVVKPIVYQAMGRTAAAPLVAQAASTAASVAALPASLAGMAGGYLADCCAGEGGAGGGTKTTCQYSAAVGAGAGIGLFLGPGGAVAGAAAGLTAASINKGVGIASSLAQGAFGTPEQADAQQLQALQRQVAYSANDILIFFRQQRIAAGWRSNYGPGNSTDTSLVKRAVAERAAKAHLFQIADRRGRRNEWHQLLNSFETVRKARGWDENYGWFTSTADAGEKREEAENRAWTSVCCNFAETAF